MRVVLRKRRQTGSLSCSRGNRIMPCGWRKNNSITGRLCSRISLFGDRMQLDAKYRNDLEL